MPPMRTSAEAFGGIDPEMAHGLEHIAAELSTGQVPYAALAGAGSPIPWGQASRATVELSPRASLTVIGAAGQLPLDRRAGMRPRGAPTPRVRLTPQRVRCRRRAELRIRTHQLTRHRTRRPAAPGTTDSPRPHSSPSDPPLPTLRSG